MMGCLPDGFKQMVPAILILTLAWTLNSTAASLGAKELLPASSPTMRQDLQTSCLPSFS